MSLSSKVLVLCCLVVVVYSVLNYAILQQLVFPGFGTLEREEAQKDLDRCVEAIRREVHHLDSLCHDWAAWDDTYDFVQDRNQDYVEANLVLSSLVDNDLNLLAICNNDGEVVWEMAIDLDTEERIQIAEISLPGLPETHPLLRFKTEEEPLEEVAVTGVFMTVQGPLLVSSRPVLTTGNEGPIRGSVIMGRFLNEGLLETLQEQTRVSFCFWTLWDDSIPAADRASADKITPENSSRIEEKSPDLLHVYTTYEDITNAPAVLLRAEIPREITARGATITRFALVSVLGSGLVVLVVLLISLKWMVLGPIADLTKHAVAIGGSTDLSDRVRVRSDDEIGTLGKAFNEMVEKLADARNRLMEQSFQSGLAEMASGILHNVRNALTPLVGRVASMRDRINETPIENIEKALKEIEEENLPQERAASLDRYIRLGSGRLAELVRETDGELDSISFAIGQIEEILSSQDTVSHGLRVRESVDIKRALEDACVLVAQHLKSVAAIEIDPSVSQLPNVRAERIVLVQVFANLLTNAAESILRTERQTGKIWVSGSVDGAEDGKTIFLEIGDDGMGMDAGTLGQVFARGFSTEGAERRGVGLHWCANTIVAMNGEIRAESDGPGQGTRVSLKIPVG